MISRCSTALNNKVLEHLIRNSGYKDLVFVEKSYHPCFQIAVILQFFS